MKYCIIIPHYKHEKLFAKFLPQIVALELPCIVVDDGSSEESAQYLLQSLAEYPDFHWVKHFYNRGKGASVITGCSYASAMGFTHCLQLDADGQHDIKDVKKLLKFSQLHSNTIVSGKPFFDDSAPKVRVYGRRITDFWVVLETLSFKIKDGLCGFRVYPIREFEYLIDNYYIAPRMDFDPEILVKAVWANIDVQFIPTKVIYQEESVSHFRYVRDNIRFIRLHIRLLAGMLVRFPRLLYARLKAALS